MARDVPVERAANCAEFWRSSRQEPMGLSSGGEKDHNPTGMSCCEMPQRWDVRGERVGASFE